MSTATAAPPTTAAAVAAVDSKSTPAAVTTATPATGTPTPTVSADAPPAAAAFASVYGVVSAHSVCRAYIPNKVPPLSIIRDALSAARFSCSSQNNQPWGATVVAGAVRDKLSAALLHAFDTGSPPIKMEYKNRPAALQPREAKCVADFGSKYLGTFGVTQHDEAGRKAVDRRNYEFFGAPINIIFHAPNNSTEGSFLDVGIFLGAVIALLEAAGLGVCPQFSITKYGDIIRSVTGIGSNRLIVCGMTVGYHDRTHKINSYKSAKMSVEECVSWVGVDAPTDAAATAPTAASKS